jgi:hypothetical protein
VPIELFTHNVNSDLASVCKGTRHGTVGTYHFHFEAIHDENASALNAQVAPNATEYGGASFPILPRLEDALLDLNVDRRKLSTGDVTDNTYVRPPRSNHDFQTLTSSPASPQNEGRCLERSDRES